MIISPENMCIPPNPRAQSEHFSSGEFQKQLLEQQMFSLQSFDPNSEKITKEKIDFEKRYSSKFLGDDNYIILSPPMGLDSYNPHRYLFNPISQKDPVFSVNIPEKNRASTKYTKGGILLEDNSWNNSGAIMISSKKKAFVDGVTGNKVAYTLFIGVQMPPKW